MKKPTRIEAENAIRTILSWIGEDPDREGLKDTPKRVIDSYEEFFSGYNEDPKKILSKTFTEIANYDNIVLVKNMRFESHCEHHMAPIIGYAHIGYMPDKKIVGISKIARLLDIFSKRLQTQEVMTSQIANIIDEALKPKGVAVLIDADHQCMTTRGVYKPETSTTTISLTGIFKEDKNMEQRFISAINVSGK